MTPALWLISVRHQIQFSGRRHTRGKSCRPLLHSPDYSSPFMLDSGLRAVLFQRDELPVLYISHKLWWESKYTTIKKECLAIKFGVIIINEILNWTVHPIRGDFREGGALYPGPRWEERLMMLLQLEFMKCLCYPFRSHFYFAHLL